MNKKYLVIGAVAATTVLGSGLALAHSAGYGPGYGPGNCGGPQMHGQYGPGMRGQYGHGPQGPMGPGMYGQRGQGPHGPGMDGRGFGPRGAMGPDMQGERGPGFQHGPRFAMLDTAHLDKLKTDLGITAEQEPAWAQYTKSVQDAATAMKTARAEFTKDATQVRQERFQAGTKMREQAQKQFETVKTAANDLTAKLTDAQKAKAQQILPGLAFGPGMARAGGPGWHHHWR